MTAVLQLDGQSLTLEDVERVSRDGQRVRLVSSARARMSSGLEAMIALAASGRPLYGINTGLGKLSEVTISPDRVRDLQLNLVLSHAAGVGEALPPEAVRAMLLLRANSLAAGYSGVRPELVDAVLALLNASITPRVPEKGSLGASGDLAPLAHMARVLLGRGEALYCGRWMPGAEALRAAGLEPITLEAKEGLALINGTQFMSALGALALVDAEQVARAADVIAALTFESLQGIPDALNPRLHELRRQPWQERVAANLRRLITGSRLTTASGEIRVQDAYALRCIPQVHGACRETLGYVRTQLERELNAVTDNPLVFSGDSPDVLSGGNFHGEPLALALDYLAIALAEWAGMAERRVERLVNPHCSGLPAFLAKDPGVHSGFMIAQYTAAALVAENKILAHPASVDSIPSSAGQEDHVSMGGVAAAKVRRVLANTRLVLAIELLSAAQAAELRRPEGMAPAARAVLAALRREVPRLEHDRELAPDIEAADRLIACGAVVQAACAVAGQLY